MNQAVLSSKESTTMQSALPPRSPVHLVDEEMSVARQTSDKFESRDDTITRPNTIQSSSAKIVTPFPEIFRNSKTGNSIHSEQDVRDTKSLHTTNVVSFSCETDEETVTEDMDDAITPLDYRREWSIEVPSSLQCILQSNELSQEIPSDILMDCESIAFESVCGDDLSNEPIVDWIDSEDIIW